MTVSSATSRTNEPRTEGTANERLRAESWTDPDHGFAVVPLQDAERELNLLYGIIERLAEAAQGAALRAEGLDVSQLFDPLSDEVGRFVARWVKPEQRADAIEDAFRLLKLAREYPFDRDWAGPPYTRHARLYRPSDERDPESEDAR